MKATVLIGLPLAVVSFLIVITADKFYSKPVYIGTLLWVIAWILLFW